MYHAYSNDELLRELEAKNSDCPLLKELSTRLFEFEEGDELINGKSDSDYTDKCVDHMQEVAGEYYMNVNSQEDLQLAKSCGSLLPEEIN